jgi:hypothetical protein
VSERNHDDLDTVVHRLRTAHNSALVVVHDERTEHVGYWDKYERLVPLMTLDYVQEQGFRIIYAGTKHSDETGQQQAWMEVRRRDPQEVYSNA